MNRTFASKLAALAGPWLAAAGAVLATPVVPPWSLVPQPVEVQVAGSQTVAVADGSAVAVRGTRHQAVPGIAERFVQQAATTRDLQLHMASAADPRDRQWTLARIAFSK